MDATARRVEGAPRQNKTTETTKTTETATDNVPSVPEVPLVARGRTPCAPP